MNTIKVEERSKIPENFTGIVEFEDGETWWLKNGKSHREDGPARIRNDGYKSWWLDGDCIWSSNRCEVNLKNTIILLEEPHPIYPNCYFLKWLDMRGIKEQIMIPGMEKCIIRCQS